MTKYTYVIGFRDTKREEQVESDYLPKFEEDQRTGEIYFVIIGRERRMYYYPTEVFIKCIYERC